MGWWMMVLMGCLKGLLFGDTSLDLGLDFGSGLRVWTWVWTSGLDFGSGLGSGLQVWTSGLDFGSGEGSRE